MNSGLFLDWPSNVEAGARRERAVERPALRFQRTIRRPDKIVGFVLKPDGEPDALSGHFEFGALRRIQREGPTVIVLHHQRFRFGVVRAEPGLLSIIRLGDLSHANCTSA